MICEVCQVFCQKIEGYGDRCPYCDWLFCDEKGYYIEKEKEIKKSSEPQHGS